MIMSRVPSLGTRPATRSRTVIISFLAAPDRRIYDELNTDLSNWSALMNTGVPVSELQLQSAFVAAA